MLVITAKILKLINHIYYNELWVPVTKLLTKNVSESHPSLVKGNSKCPIIPYLYLYYT